MGGRFLKRFRFPLETALTVRELRKLMAEEKLGALVREMHQIEKTLEDIRVTAFENQAHLRRRLWGRLDRDKVRDHLRFQKALDKDAMVFEERFSNKACEVGQAQGEVILRNQEMKALERLKERRLCDYKTSYWWEHSKQMDQISAVYFGRDKVRR